MSSASHYQKITLVTWKRMSYSTWCAWGRMCSCWANVVEGGALRRGWPGLEVTVLAGISLRIPVLISQQFPLASPSKDNISPKTPCRGTRWQGVRRNQLCCFKHHRELSGTRREDPLQADWILAHSWLVLMSLWGILIQRKLKGSLDL